MDLMKNIFNNPYRDNYKNSFDEDEFIGDYSINFRSEPTDETLLKIGTSIVNKCVIDCKKLFKYIEEKRIDTLSEGFIKKREKIFFTKKIPFAISFVDVRNKGFIVEDFCIKISIDKSLITDTYKYNSFITRKNDLIKFINNSIK